MNSINSTCFINLVISRTSGMFQEMSENFGTHQVFCHFHGDHKLNRNFSTFQSTMSRGEKQRKQQKINYKIDILNNS